MKSEGLKLMNIQDLAYVVSHMELEQILLQDVLEEYFYILEGKKLASANFTRIMASLEAIRALHIESTEVVRAIGENTEGVVLDEECK